VQSSSKSVNNCINDILPFCTQDNRYGQLLPCDTHHRHNASKKSERISHTTLFSPKSNGKERAAKDQK
jgi:hypothetical protein